MMFFVNKSIPSNLGQELTSETIDSLVQSALRWAIEVSDPNPSAVAGTLELALQVIEVSDSYPNLSAVGGTLELAPQAIEVSDSYPDLSAVADTLELAAVVAGALGLAAKAGDN